MAVNIRKPAILEMIKESRIWNAGTSQTFAAERMIQEQYKREAAANRPKRRKQTRRQKVA